MQWQQETLIAIVMLSIIPRVCPAFGTLDPSGVGSNGSKTLSTVIRPKLRSAWSSKLYLHQNNTDPK